MGHQFTIESEEAAALAAELAALTGTGVEAAVVEALRAGVEGARVRALAEAEPLRRRATAAEMLAAADEFAEMLGHPLPSSDHSWLYDDETGLPI